MGYIRFNKLKHVKQINIKKDNVNHDAKKKNHLFQSQFKFYKRVI